MSKERFDYEVIKPDHSEIDIRKGYNHIVGKFIWDLKEHQYKFLGLEGIDMPELFEILESMRKLNKKSILPSWLRWK